MDPADQSQVCPFPLPNPPPRYGTDQHHQWSPWRETGKQYPNPRIQQLELNSSHQLSGFFYNRTGELKSIYMRNLDNEERQEIGMHKPSKDWSLIVAPSFSVESILRLSHLSRDEKCGNYSICFNIS